ncbi:MAG TPA: MFS transporter, partial [Candidatus Binatia bacterium]|nr:MFS transporter [Candidatus Binatia bacterium]
KLWAAETISQFGTQVSLLAVPLVAIVLLEATPFEVGLLGTVEFLPFILFSLPAGAWVDRLRRRPLLIVGDLGRALSLASIPIAYELGVLTIWQLYLVGFVNGILTVFFDVAYQAYLPSLVDRDQIVEGNSKLEISRSAAQIGGPGLGGLLIGLLTAPVAVVIDALSYLGSALFVWRIRRPEPAPGTTAEGDPPRPSMRAEVVEGIRYVLGQPLLRSIAACTALSNLFGTVGFAVYLVFLVRIIGLSAEQIGLVASLGNVSTLVGAVTAAAVARRLGVGPTIIASAILFGPGLVLVALAPAGPAAIPLLVAAGLLFGLSTIVYNINQVSLRQAITPTRLQGRMNATMRFIVWGTIPLGQIAGGALGTVVGLRETIWIGAVGSLFAFLPLLVGPLRRLREVPAPALEG